jgi:histidyl-tRNA synthetase
MGQTAGVTAEQAGRVLDLAALEGTNEEILNALGAKFGTNSKAAEGIARLRELVRVTAEAGVPAERLQIDLSIARGLDYYTGTVYETFLADLPTIGSVCSGGRYDNLASLYTKQVLPGVGASLGLDRLLAAMEELKLLDSTSTAAPVLIVQFSGEFLGAYQRVARTLRAAGVGVEVFPDAKKMGQQLAYADKRGFRFALIAGPDEMAKGVWQVKDLRKNESRTVAEAELVGEIQKALSQ